MSDLGRDMARALRVEWTPTRMRTAEAGMHARRRRRQIVRAALAASAVVAIALVWRHEATEMETIAVQPVASPPLVVAPVQPTQPARAVDVPAPAPVPPPSKKEIAKAPRVPKPAVGAKSTFAGSREVVETWSDLARVGEYDKAYEALTKAPPLRDIPDELLLAADVKRLSHHADEAVAPLRQVVRDHASDPRAPLAAFTLGRVLLELRRASEAAEAFTNAHALAPDGPLAEDAFAREVEARSLAGDTNGARRSAEDYVRRFPAGRKLKSVRRWGGLP